MPATRMKTFRDSDPTLIRDFLRKTLPLIPSKTPTKPGPIHISNSFLSHAIGDGSLKAELPTWLKGNDDLDDFVNVEPESIQRETDHLRRFLQVVFDSDGNVFKTFSSPFPASSHFVSRDATDNGYSLGLWMSLGDKNRIEIATVLSDLLSDSLANDAMSNVLASLIKTTPKPTLRSTAVSGSTQFGENIGQILINGLQRGVGKPLHFRIELMRQFSILLSSFVVIGMLYDSCKRLPNVIESSQPSDILGTFCFTGNTAGRSITEKQLSDLAKLSLRDTLERSYSGIKETFSAIYLDKRKVNKKSWSQFALELTTDHLTGESATKMVNVLNGFGESEIQEVIPSLYPKSNLRTAVKSLGYKSGMVWPNKGGEPRIVLDSSFVTSLVAFMGEVDMSVDDFSEIIYKKLGLVFGYQGISAESITKLEEISGSRVDIPSLLVESQKHLSLRLVSAGLARQYSDGTAALIGSSI
jgi:hypothetical protein